MPTLVTPGDRQVLAGGSLSSLKRNSVPLSMFPGGAVNTAGGGTVSYQRLYETQIWVAAAVNVLTQEVSRLPLKLYRVQDDGQRDRVRDHPLAKLLQFPYPRASATRLKQKLMQPALIQGNSLLWKKRPASGAPPEALLPLDWRFLKPILNDAWDVLGWECTQPRRPKFIAPEDVVHVAWEGGRGDLGVSPLSYLERTLRTEDASQRFLANYYDNGIRNSGAFVLPADAKTNKEQRDELREHLARTQAGVDNAGKPLLLFNGAKFESTQQTAVEAEVIDQRKLNREEIAAAYKIPPPLIGILDHATYSNIDTQKDLFYGMVLGPWLTLHEETLQAQLIEPEWPGEGLVVEYDLAEVLKGDTLKEVQAIREAIATGIMTPNEGRQIRNLPPSADPEADRLHMPTNNLSPMGTVPDPAKAIERHVELAALRARDKGDPGIDRFRRELAEDTGDERLADEWAAKVATAAEEHAIRALLTA